MPRDGSTGQFNLPAGNPYVNGTVIDETVVNATMSDLATGLTNSIAKDGQTTVTGNIPMGGNKFTNVAAGSAANQNPIISQIQDGSLLTLGSVSGTDTIVGSLTPAISSYTARMLVTFTPANNNTGAATIAINGLAAKSIVKGNAAALVAGDLVTTCPAVILYDGTNFVLLNPQHNVPNDEVTFARMQDIATDTLIGRATAGSGDPETVACTAAGRALIDDASASAQRTTLGSTATGDALFTTASASAARSTLGVSATGADTTYSFRANNLSDLASAVTARSNLGLVIGTDVLAPNGSGASLTGVLKTANNLSDVTASTARSNLGVTATGSDTTYNYRANNLSDVANAATARGNLGSAASATTISVSGTGLSGGGDLSTNRTITIDQTAMTTRNITGKSGISKTLSTSSPSGGSDGDIWYKY